MQNKSALALTDYQRAILTEVGVTFWQYRDPSKPSDEQNNLNATPTHQPTIAAKSQVKSPQAALEALKQLKGEVLELESTDHILLALSEHDNKSKMLTDILIAMGLDDKEREYISAEKFADYKDYPLSWQQGAHLALEENQLTTCTFAELSRPELKKQLWEIIQQYISSSNNHAPSLP